MNIVSSAGVTMTHEHIYSLSVILSHKLYIYVYTCDSGLPQGFMLNDASQYAFVRNLQGDVIAMVDQNGKTVVEYSYDPWGNIEYHLNEEIEDEQTAMLITALCPLTYRGYNYDFTTGLYYLQSRYYNPEWGRFLNCDDTNILLATQGETHNANLFAYCNNNPINNADYSGYEAEEIVITVLYALIAVIALERVHESYKEINDIFPKTPVTEKSGSLTDPFQPSKTVWKYMPTWFYCDVEYTDDVIYLKIKIGLFNSITNTSEYFIEIRTDSEWEQLMHGGKIKSKYDKFCEKHHITMSALTDPSMGDIGMFVSCATGALDIGMSAYSNMKYNSMRSKYIRHQMDKQKSLYNDDATCLLNSYCFYLKTKSGIQNYIEHDCEKEYKKWSKKK